MSAPTEAAARILPLRTSRGWLLLAFFYVYVLLYGGTAHALLQPVPFTLVRALALFVLVLGAFHLFRRHSVMESLGDGIDYALIGVGAMAALTTAIAVEPLRSWENIGLGLAYVVLLYLTVNWIRSRASVYPLAVLVALGNVAVCAGAWVIPALASWLGGLDVLSGYLIYPLGHWNLTGSYLLLTSPVLVGLAVGPGGRVRWGWWLAFAFALLTVMQSGSRIAVLVTVGQLLLAGIAFLVRGRRTIARAALAVLGLAVIAGMTLESSRIWDRLATLPDSGIDAVAGRALTDASAAQRLDMWRGAWSKLYWVGNGLGSVPLQFGNQMLQSPRFPTLGAPHLHNSYLNLAFELGLPGVMAALLLAGFVLNASWLSLARAEADGPLIAAAIWGLAGYLVSLLVLYHPYVPAMTVSMVLVAALCLSRVPGQLIGQTRLFLGFNLALAVAAVGVPFAAASYAFWAYDRSLGDWQQDRTAALEQLREAVHYDPLDLFPRLALGLALSHQPGRADREEGLQQLEWVNVRSQLPTSRLIAGRLALQLEETTRAVTILEQAVRLRYYDGFYHFALARAYLADGHAGTAVEVMARACLFSPVLLDAAVWQEPAWAARREAVLARAVTVAQAHLATRPRSAEMAYRLGRFYGALGNQTEARAHYDNARQFLQVPDADQQPGLARRLAYATGLAWWQDGRHDLALSWWNRARRTDPYHPAALAALGQLWLERGRPDVGKPLLEQAASVYRRLDPAITPARLAAKQGGTWAMRVGYDERWFAEAFRRPTPPFLGWEARMTLAALPFADETSPWIYMPKMQALQTTVPTRRGD